MNIMKQISWSEIGNYVGKHITIKNNEGKQRTILVDRYVNGLVISGNHRSETYFPFNPKDEKDSDLKIYVN